MTNFFELALCNGPAIKVGFEAILAVLSDKEKEALQDFAEWVEAEALISINADVLVVIELLNGGRYQNDCQWAADQSRLSGRPAEERRRERLGKWYHKRVAFEAAFDHGSEFQYGALNAGGEGLPQQYGVCCLVLSRTFQDSLQHIAYLPGDSLIVCFDRDGALDPRAVERLVAPHGHRHLLVVNERKSEILAVERHEWPRVLLSPSRYFEVVFIGDVTLAAVYGVRMSKADYARKWEMTFNGFAWNPDEADRALIQDFLQLRRAELDGRIRLEVVA